MPPKPNARKWNDVETAIATAAIVTTIGLWNLFATPAKTLIAEAQPQESNDTSVPPPTESPVTAQQPVSMPQVKIMFTPGAPQTTTIQQSQQQVQPQVRKKKKNNSNNSGSTNNANAGSPSVTQTKSS